MSMKTQATMTECHAKKLAFYTKMQQLRDNRQQSVGRFGRYCNHGVVVRAKW